MRLLMVPGLCLAVLLIKAQVKIVEPNFRKYSVPIMGYGVIDSSKVAGISGTGFFIRKNNRLFLVTALHVLDGCVNDSTKMTSIPDTVFIIMKSLDNKHRIFIPIPFLKDQPCETIDQVPDLAVVAINDTNLPVQYSVESFLTPSFKSVNALRIAGYPVKTKPKPDLFYSPPAVSSINLRINDSHIRQAIVGDRPDSLNFWINCGKKAIANLGGYSGSPVFMKESNSSRWRLAGVFVAANVDSSTGEQWLVVCRVDNLMGMLESK